MSILCEGKFIEQVIKKDMNGGSNELYEVKVGNALVHTGYNSQVMAWDNDSLSSMKIYNTSHEQNRMVQNSYSYRFSHYDQTTKEATRTPIKRAKAWIYLPEFHVKFANSDESIGKQVTLAMHMGAEYEYKYLSAILSYRVVYKGIDDNKRTLYYPTYSLALCRHNAKRITEGDIVSSHTYRFGQTEEESVSSEYLIGDAFACAVSIGIESSTFNSDMRPYVAVGRVRRDSDGFQSTARTNILYFNKSDEDLLPAISQAPNSISVQYINTGVGTSEEQINRNLENIKTRLEISTSNDLGNGLFNNDAENKHYIQNSSKDESSLDMKTFTNSNLT